jgi:integrase
MLAVRRKQLTEHPLRYLDPPKWSKGKVEVYKDDECERLLRAARDDKEFVPWALLMYTALMTGMRRAELLNLVWVDVDFGTQEIHVTPKADTAETWRGLIKGH